MADRTGIEWTDATWNPITGCSVVSAGCKHCYAMKLAGTRLAHHPSRAGLTIDTKAGPVWTGEVRFNRQWLDQPLRWRRPRKVFVCAHSDLFHESVPDEWIDLVFAAMLLAPQHIFQVLTKRAQRMRAYCSDPATVGRVIAQAASFGAKVESTHVEDGMQGIYLSNVWLGVSVEDQAAADERIPLLLQCPAAVRWISAEPLLGPVDLDHLRGNPGPPALPEHNVFTAIHPTAPWKLDWVVAGGESGPGARPMHPDWARSLRDQCAAGGVPFLFKQWGAWAPSGQFVPYPVNDGTTVRVQTFPDLTCALCIGKKAAGRLLDGVQHDGYPEVRGA